MQMDAWVDSVGPWAVHAVMRHTGAGRVVRLQLCEEQDVLAGQLPQQPLRHHLRSQHLRR